MKPSTTAAKILALFLVIFATPSLAASPKAIALDAEINAALDSLYNSSATARELSKSAKGILVFPSITKGGLIVGGLHGTGGLRVGGKTDGYYQVNAGSIGLQAGVQTVSNVLMFMTEDALSKFRNSGNWQAGVDGNVTFATVGASGEATTKNLKKPIIGFIFNNEGLFGGISLEGAKISSYTPE